MRSEVEHMPLEGQQLGRYHLLRLLGSGGMGEVYLAEDPRIEQQVAIKVLRAEASAYPNVEATREAGRLFLREVKAIAKLDHPNTLPLYDYGEATIHGATLAYMVMPYRQEGSLTNWLRQRGSTQLLPPEVVAHFIRQAADALQDAHDHQIMHQDIKPANFLIRSNKDNLRYPDLLLSDFGIAKFSNLGTANTSHTIRGTPAYMAPEQWNGHPVQASDQYALAVMAYELLTGRQPFHGSFEQVMYQHFHEEPLPPSRLNPNLPPDVDTIFRIALAKQPEQRFASVTAFARALEHALLDRSSYNDPTVIRTPSPAEQVNDPVRVEQRTPAHVQPRRDEGPKEHRQGLPKGITIMLVVLAILVGGGTVAFLYPKLTERNSTTQTQTPATTPTTAATSQPTTIATNPANNSQNPYPPNTGNMVLNDSMVDNSKNWDWQLGTNNNNATCAFAKGGYDVTQPAQGFFHSCTAYNTNFSNFTYEVQMTMISGDYAGIIFCKESTDQYYLFRIYTNGTYSLLRNVDANIDHAVPLANGSFAYSGTGIIGVVVNGGTINLYFNRQQIGSASDSAYTHGQIAVLTGNNTTSAETVFNNAKVWQL
jgi:eukaryotic-like serine/threonine-protein kinase